MKGLCTRGSTHATLFRCLPCNKRSSGSISVPLFFSLQVEEPSAPTWDGAGHSHGQDRGWSWPQSWSSPHGIILSAARKERLTDTGLGAPSLAAQTSSLSQSLPLDIGVAGQAVPDSPKETDMTTFSWEAQSYPVSLLPQLLVQLILPFRLLPTPSPTTCPSVSTAKQENISCYLLKLDHCTPPGLGLQPTKRQTSGLLWRLIPLHPEAGSYDLFPSRALRNPSGQELGQNAVTVCSICQALNKCSVNESATTHLLANALWRSSLNLKQGNLKSHPHQNFCKWWEIENRLRITGKIWN